MKFGVALIVVIVFPMLIYQDSEPQMAPTFQYTLLCHAYETRDMELCQILLDAKIDLNIRDEVQ